MKKVLENLRYNFLMIWIWVGHKVFGWHYIDIYAPGKKDNPDADVVGITLSSSEEYINKVFDIEPDHEKRD